MNARYLNDWQVVARSLVVIDPEDREQVERLLTLYLTEYDGEDSVPQDGEVDSMQLALRSLITPPKPVEPTGLGAVVEDADGVVWVRNLPTTDGCAWRSDRPVNSAGVIGWRTYDEITAVKVLSEGVTP